jgi:hypothetical protein
LFHRPGVTARALRGRQRRLVFVSRDAGMAICAGKRTVHGLREWLGPHRWDVVWPAQRTRGQRLAFVTQQAVGIGDGFGGAGAGRCERQYGEGQSGEGSDAQTRCPVLGLPSGKRARTLRREARPGYATALIRSSDHDAAQKLSCIRIVEATPDP